MSPVDRCLAILERFGNDVDGNPDWWLMSPTGQGRGWQGAFGQSPPNRDQDEPTWEAEAEGSLLGVLLKLVMACHSWSISHHESEEFYRLLLGVGDASTGWAELP